MPGVVSTIEISAHPQAIWKLLCDPSVYPELADPTDRMISVPDGEFDLGYSYREYGGIPPFKRESEWMVTDYEPVTRQVHVGNDGRMRLQLEILLDPFEGGTRLTALLTFAPRWYLVPISAVLWPILMRPRARAAMDRTVANVKRMVE